LCSLITALHLKMIISLLLPAAKRKRYVTNTKRWDSLVNICTVVCDMKLMHVPLDSGVHTAKYIRVRQNHDPLVQGKTSRMWISCYLLLQYFQIQRNKSKLRNCTACKFV